MAAEKITEVPLESIRLLESKGRTVAAEPISTYIQVNLILVALRPMAGGIRCLLALSGVREFPITLCFICMAVAMNRTTVADWSRLV